MGGVHKPREARVMASWPLSIGTAQPTDKKGELTIGGCRPFDVVKVHPTKPLVDISEEAQAQLS